MDCDFSEFTYGYAALRDAEATIGEQYQQAGAPYLPSLLEEAQHGWDAMINTTVDYALFLQFKRPEFVSRRHPASPTWDDVGGQHYRLSLDSDSPQHHALCNLESQITLGELLGEVYYAFPGFHQQNEFDAAYQTGAILHESILLPPSEIQPGTGPHHYTRCVNGIERVHSEPRPPEKRQTWDTVFSGVRLHAENWLERTDQERMTVGALEETLLTSVRALKPRFEAESSASPMRRIHQLSAMLGCGLVAATNRENNQAS